MDFFQRWRRNLLRGQIFSDSGTNLQRAFSISNCVGSKLRNWCTLLIIPSNIYHLIFKVPSTNHWIRNGTACVALGPVVSSDLHQVAPDVGWLVWMRILQLVWSSDVSTPNCSKDDRQTLMMAFGQRDGKTGLKDGRHHVRSTRASLS